MDCWNISWSSVIVYKSAGGPTWTGGTSSGVMESSIKVLQECLDYGSSTGVMKSSIKVLENQVELLEHQLDS